MLDTRRLRVLVEVARHGSFSAAADALGYTQPAVSRQIATLEAEVGTLLVRRVPQGAVLTDAGRLLVARAEVDLRPPGRRRDRAPGLHGLEGGTLKLASFASAAASVLPLAVARFRERYPGVALEIAMADPVDSIAGCAPASSTWRWSTTGCPRPSRRSSVVQRTADIELVPLFEDPMYVAMAPGASARRAARATALTGATSPSDPWMLATSTTCPDARLFLRACHAAGFEPRVAFQNDDYAAILGFVAAGVGVALIPDMVARGVRDDVVIRELAARAAGASDRRGAARRLPLARRGGDARGAGRGRARVGDRPGDLQRARSGRTLSA